MRHSFFIPALLGLFIALPAHALEEDRNQPISLKAERVEINHKDGISTYEGGVELQQGSLWISAARIVVRSKGSEVTRIEADGTPAKIRQRPAPDKEEIRAEARHMEYDLQAATVRLSGQAHLWQESNEFRGETITYDSQRGLVRASGSEQKKERIEVIIQPRKEGTP
ncbi:MAG TPA: lipopolysaccharide transport periplasmic protein LptA [Gammaproteobacteria bacterium]